MQDASETPIVIRWDRGADSFSVNGLPMHVTPAEAYVLREVTQLATKGHLGFSMARAMNMCDPRTLGGLRLFQDVRDALSEKITELVGLPPTPKLQLFKVESHMYTWPVNVRFEQVERQVTLYAEPAQPDQKEYLLLVNGAGVLINPPQHRLLQAIVDLERRSEPPTLDQLAASAAPLPVISNSDWLLARNAFHRTLAQLEAIVTQTLRAEETVHVLHIEHNRYIIARGVTIEVAERV